jgi:hypothetical protein
MNLKRLKPKLKNIKIHKSAMEKQRQLKSSIKKKIPTTGAQLGKTIEKKLTASQKVWNNVGVALFSQKSLENVSHFSSYLLGVLMILLTDIVLIFPTSRKALAPGALVTNFFVILVGLFIANGVVYVALRAIGSKTEFKTFFSTANTALFLSMLVISIPAALVSFALFSTMLRSEQAISMFFSIIPFYNYLIYGWAAEKLANLKGIRSILVGLISLALILFLNLLIGHFMV